MSVPFFSIVVPVYKVEKYIRQCVDSILEQTCNDYELILVDDGTPDLSGEICDDYSRNNEKITVFHKKNEGLSMARNDGLKKAIGKYVIFVDSDDFWDDAQFLSKAKDKLLSNPTVDILIFGSKKVFRDGSKTDIRIPYVQEHSISIEQLMRTNSYIACAWDKMVSRDFLEKNGIEFVKNQLSEDIEWCIKLLLASPRVDIIPISPYVYRQQNADSITSNISRKNLLDICNVINKYKDKIDNEALMSFLSLEYVLWMIPSNMVPKKQIIDLLQEMKNNIFLMDYCWYPYVKKTKPFRFLGFTILRRMIYFAYVIKRRIR